MKKEARPPLRLNLLSLLPLLSLFLLIVSSCTSVPPEEIVAPEEPLSSPNETSDRETSPPEISTTIPADEPTPEQAHAPYPEAPSKEEKSINSVTWYHDTEWKPSSTPPTCPEPLIVQTPVDIDLATSILYPGQMRGEHYKAHGGFRFDHSHNEDITVTAPLDGLLVRGSRYIESGEIQYMFDLVNPCGIMIRFDHLLELSPKFAEAAEKLRPAVVDDSRTTELNLIPIKTGEVIATAVGFKTTGNVGVDFGVYDLRQKNQASQDPAWLQQHPGEQAAYAVCWLDWLPAEDSVKAKSLPGGDSVNGKESDYCE